MAKPWEKYSGANQPPPATESAGPWSKYNTAKNVRIHDGLYSGEAGGAEGGSLQQPPESFADQALHMGLNALPIAGGIIGGIAGTVAGAPTGPGALATGVGGAALGTAAGESYKQLGENYFFNKRRAPLEATKDIALAGGEGALSQVVGNGIGKVGGAIARTAPVKSAVSAVGSGLAKVGEGLTGISKKAIETYAKHAPEISQMSKSAGGDVQVAADAIRKNFNSAIQSARHSLNAQLEKGLSDNASKSVSVTPILDELAKHQEKINPHLNPEDLAHLDVVLRRIHSLSKDGQLSLKNAHEVKGYLQDLATGAYNKGGQIFLTGKDVAQGARAGAAVTRKAVNKEAAEVAAANNGLSNLHNIERGMNKNMLKEGETVASLLGAGSGSNAKNAQHLKRLGRASNTDMLSEAEKLNAMKVFGDAPVLPWDMTGKAASRMALGAGLGYAADGKDGALVGATLTSPLALKGVIRGGRGVMQAANALGKGALQQATGRVASGVAADHMPDMPGENTPTMRDRAPGEMVADQPLKGKDKWAADGFAKLGEHDKTLATDAAKEKLNDAEGKRLLIQASDLKPGSKALDKIAEQIKAKLAKGKS